MINKVGKIGSGGREFRYPTQLAISPNQRLYVTDTYNDRLQILTTKLEFTDSLQHQTMHYPIDVKFSNDEIFVLSKTDWLCIHVFTLSGEMTRSIVTRGSGMQIKSARFSGLPWMRKISSISISISMSFLRGYPWISISTASLKILLFGWTQ